MSLRQATLLFTVATLKSVDDHCGYCFPFDPFYIMLKNNTEFHDIHHQVLRPLLTFLSASDLP
jgi:sphinganine C4-monooxygenase